MKKITKITLSIFISLLLLGIFGTSCFFAYKLSWNILAFWWAWFGIIWIIDLFVGGYLFYKKNKTDESKTFWLFVMIVLPIIGAVIALIFNYKLDAQYDEPDNDHAKLQSAIFKAKKTIKIYSNSFFASTDTFQALNFIVWNGVKIQIIISTPKKKSTQNFLIYQLQKKLEERIELYLTNKEITNSFIIIDDEYVISSPKNFNFKTVYNDKCFSFDENIQKYLTTWNNDIERCSLYSLVKPKINIFKNIKYKIMNIFYLFY